MSNGRVVGDIYKLFDRECWVMGNWEEDRKYLLEKLNELDNLIDGKLRSRFNLDDYSTEYRKLDGELTLRINNSEFYASFGSSPSILICKDVTKRRDEIYVELELVDGEWMMTTHSIMSPDKSKYTPFTESVLDRTIRQFIFVSGYKE